MRAITFPKTGPDEWTNRETGVQIQRVAAGYVVRVPVRDGHEVEYDRRTRTSARETAVAYAVPVVRSEIGTAYEAACREDAERMAKAEDDGLIHHAGDAEFRADCGVDVLRTPYTYASPEWSEVTCKACLLSAPTAIGA